MKKDRPIISNLNRQENRDVIVETAAKLLAKYGTAGVTTRAVAADANVQSPAIYRLFGDKNGLLDAVAENAFTNYTKVKTIHKIADPMDELTHGWNMYIDFGLANPHLFTVMAEPGRAAKSSAAGIGKDVLVARIRRIAAAGKLKVNEQLAVDLIQAAGIGVVFTMLSKPKKQQDRSIADIAFKTLLETITTVNLPSKDANITIAANTLRARSDEIEGVLSSNEVGLLKEWLDRIISN